MPPLTKHKNDESQTVFSESLCNYAPDDFTSDSEYVNTASSHQKELYFYTIGYESRTAENFISRLKSKGITQVIDVREKPISRKKGFSKTALTELLKKEQIKYVHFPRLGSPSNIRQELKNGGSEIVFFNKYEKYVRENEMDSVKVLEECISAEPSVLMCFELAYIHCHRRVLADLVTKMGHKVVHI